MKKIAFMFVAAAMFVACGGNAEKAAEVQAPVIDTAAITAQFDNFVYELTAEDSAAIKVEGVDTLAACCVDSIVAAKKAEAIAAALEEAAKVAAEQAAPAEEK